MNCEKHIKIHAPHCPICANEEREALLRVARAAKNLKPDDWPRYIGQYVDAEVKLFEALKEVEHLL